MASLSLSLSAAAATVLVCVGDGEGIVGWLMAMARSDDFHLAVIWREP